MVVILGQGKYLGAGRCKDLGGINVAGKYVDMKIIILQLLVVLVLFCSGAEAKGIEAELWGISWDADASQVKQSLEGQGLVLIEQGKDSNGNQWQKFGNGLYSGFQCDVKVVWQEKCLAEINIESTGVFLLGTESTYRKLEARFTDEYGQPKEKDRYMLKIFPGIWVELAKWVVTDQGRPSFEVTVVQNSPVDGPETETARPAKIYISFKQITGKIR